jgi:hypothetical protein
MNRRQCKISEAVILIEIETLSRLGRKFYPKSTDKEVKNAVSTNNYKMFRDFALLLIE